MAAEAMEPPVEEEPESTTEEEAAPAEEEPETEEDAPVVLTEIADHDRSLFEDPNLAVASMASGESTEIVVPVQIGEGEDARKYKLSIVLKLDPVD
jgi:hypothetical protein